MTDIFKEVDEVMRQERLATLWAENKVFIISAIAGTILLTALISGYKSWDSNIQTKQTNIAFELLNAPDFPDNIKPDTINTRNNLKAMVLLQAAAAYLDANKTKEAKALYESASEIKGAGKYQNLSRLMKARLQDESPAETLEPILKDKNNLWRPQALLDLAAYEATQNNNYTQALNHIDAALNAPNTPASLRQKAQALQHVYTLKNKEQNPE